MRKIVPIILFLFLSLNTASAQKGYEKDLKIAHAYMKIGEYSNAIKYFSKCYSKHKSPKTALQLAECYINSGQFAQSEDFLLSACNRFTNHSILQKKLIETHILNGHYTKAKKALTPQIKSEDSIFWYKKMAISDSANHWLQLPNQVRLLNLKEINTEYSEAGASWFKNGLLFASTRESIFIKTKNGQTNEPFYDLYFAAFDGDHFKHPASFSNSINSPDHEVGVAFSKNYEEIYFTRSIHKEYNNSSDDHVNHLKLYRAHRTTLGWSKPEVFLLNDSTDSFGHPTIAHDDGVFIFVSDMPGGYGGTDLYISLQLDSNTWTIPENLGPLINTPDNEIFPFLTEEGTLYFSSNGHIGLGGYDIFKSKLIKGEWTPPENLKYPTNSSRDDFAYSQTRDGKRKFITSNRAGGMGKEDIYELINK